MGNAVSGVTVGEGATGNLIGGSEPGAGNIISGNDGPGVGIAGGASDNRLQGNYIGTDVSGMSPLSNNGAGVVLTQGAYDNLIGGDDPGEANIIAFNLGHGVEARSDAGNGNAIIRNSIHSNQGLGIDLNDDGVTSNDPLDADSGPNALQNYPAITGLEWGLPGGRISGSISSVPNTHYTVEFFSNSVCDESVHGEGKRFLGDLSVATDALGEATFSDTPGGFGLNVFLTARATDDAGNTSEFSRCRATGYTVVDPGGQHIVDSPRIAGEPSGFRLEADPAGSPPPASVKLCRVATVWMTAGDVIEVQCGSASMRVVQGPVELQLDVETQAIVPSGSIVTVEEMAEGRIMLRNDSPAGTEPILIVVGDEVVAEVDPGETLHVATLEIEKAEVDREGGPEAEDQFEIIGLFVPVEGGNGIDILTEDVTFTLGGFTWTIPAGAFEYDDIRQEFEFESQEVDGEEMEAKIGVTGEFGIQVTGLDLSTLNLTVPVPFAMQIGDDLGTATIPFDDDGEFAR